MTRFIRFRKSSETITFDSPVPDFRGNSFLPTVAVIPLLQHEGYSSVPVVSPGERVREGQLLARGNGHDSAHIHSSIPGVVQEIRNVSLPDGKMGPAAVIRLSGSFDILGRKEPNYPWRTIPESEILRVLEEKGVINTFESAVPLVPYLRDAKKTGKPVLVLRLFDNDPSCELDAFLVRNNLQSVLDGTALIAKSMDAGTVYIVHEGKSLAGSARQMLSDIFLKDVVKLLPVKTRYPTGNTAYISGRIPEKNLILIDPVTALSAFDAVVHNQPVLQRFVSVSGPALDSPAILKVRIGTPVGDIIEECGGFKSDPARIVVNGLLAGTAIYDLDTPVTKYTK
jgi:electron transport complex protein RnfC